MNAENENPVAVPVDKSPRIFEIPVRRMDSLYAKIAPLNKRARHLGVPEIVVVEGKHIVRSEKVRCDESLPNAVEGDDGHWYADLVVEFVPVEIKSPVVKLPGWSFVAAIEHLGGEDGSGNLVHVMNGENLPESYRSAPAKCDHCKMDRRRNDSFVVRHDGDNDLKQVGRNCLRDFLGHKDAEGIANFLSMLAEFAEFCEGCEDDFSEYGGGYGGADGFGVENVLAVAAYAVEKYGFWSRKQAEIHHRRSSVDDVSDYLYPPKGDREWKNRWPAGCIGDAQKAKAKLAVEWALGLSDEALAEGRSMNDYEFNCYAIAKAGYGKNKHLGLIVSIMGAYDRAMGVKRERAAAALASNHVGVVGERGVFKFKFLGSASFESQFGGGLIVRLVSPEGNRAVWFASGNGGHNMVAEMEFPENKDRVWNLEASIKSHGDYKGVKQSVLSRVKFAKGEFPEQEKAKADAKAAAKAAKKVIAKVAKKAVADCPLPGDDEKAAKYLADEVESAFNWQARSDRGAKCAAEALEVQLRLIARCQEEIANAMLPEANQWQKDFLPLKQVELPILFRKYNALEAAFNAMDFQEPDPEPEPSAPDPEPPAHDYAAEREHHYAEGVVSMESLP